MKRVSYYDALFYFNVGAALTVVILSGAFMLPELLGAAIAFSVAAVAFRVAAIVTKED